MSNTPVTFFFVLCLALSPPPAGARDPQPGEEASAQQLKSLTLEQLGNLEVTTVSKEPEALWQTPAAIYVLNQDDIRRSGATTIPDLLRTVPGVEVAEMQSNQWAVAIRGFNGQFSRDVLLLIDGRSAYTELFEGVYWDVQDVPLNDIERIEIIRGPGGAIWGANAVNGVIDIITKDAADTQGVLATALSGHVDRFNGAVRAGWRYRKSLQYRLFVHGFDREPEIDPGFDGYDRWHLVHGGFRVDWNPNHRDSVSANGDLYTGQSGQQIGLGVYSPLQQTTLDGSQAVSGGDLLLHWTHQYAHGSDFRWQASFDRTNRQGPQFGETRNTVDFDFIDHLALSRQDVIWGAGARLSPSYFIQSQPTVDFVPHRQTDYIYSLFLQDTLHLVPDYVDLIAGSKLKYNNFSGFEYQPNVRLLWNPHLHTTLWAAASRAVRTPGRLDQDLQLTGVVAAAPPILVRIEGDPFFKSEVLLGFEAGYRQLLLDKLYADLSAFHNRYERLESYGTIYFSTISSPISALLIDVPYANGIDAVTDGFEIAPDWTPTRWWELKGNYSYLHLRAQPRPGYSDTATAASYQGSSPHRESSLQSSFDLPHALEFVLDYRYVSRLPAQSVTGYQTADARLGWKMGQFQLFAAGRNLLQPHHQEFTGDNGNTVGIRRALYAGLTWSR